MKTKRIMMLKKFDNGYATAEWFYIAENDSEHTDQLISALSNKYVRSNDGNNYTISIIGSVPSEVARTAA